MAEAKLDANTRPTLIGVSSADLLTPTRIAVNPTTGAMLIDKTSLDARFVNVTGDTMTGALTIDGTADVVQQTVQGHSTQTANLTEWQDSSGNKLVQIDAIGRFLQPTKTSEGLVIKGFDNTPTADILQVQRASDTIPIMAVRWITGLASGTGGLFVNGPMAIGGTALVTNTLLVASSNASDPTATDTYGANFSRNLVLTSSNSRRLTGGLFNVSTRNNNFNHTGVLTGGDFRIQSQNIATIDDVKGGFFLVYNIGVGTITDAYAGFFNIQNLVAGGTITNAYRNYLKTNFNNGTIVNEYGLYVENVNSATTINNAITTNAGNIIFNEGGDAGTDVRMETNNLERAFFVDGGTDDVLIDDRSVLRYAMMMT